MFNPFMGGTSFKEMKEFLEYVEEKEKRAKDDAKRKPDRKWSFLGIYILLATTFPLVIFWSIVVTNLALTWSEKIHTLIK